MLSVVVCLGSCREVPASFARGGNGWTSRRPKGASGRESWCVVGVCACSSVAGGGAGLWCLERRRGPWPLPSPAATQPLWRTRDADRPSPPLCVPPRVPPACRPANRGLRGDLLLLRQGPGRRSRGTLIRPPGTNGRPTRGVLVQRAHRTQPSPHTHVRSFATTWGLVGWVIHLGRKEGDLSRERERGHTTPHWVCRRP